MDNGDNILSRLNNSACKDNYWCFPFEKSQILVSQLQIGAKTYARKLIACGFQRGDFVGFICSTHSDFIQLLFACWYVGIIPVPLRYQAGRQVEYSEHINACHDVCSFKGIIYDDNLEASYLNNIGAFETFSISQIKAVLINENDLVLSNTFFDSNHSTITLNDIALIQFSSGSTGEPKGVVVTHQMIMAQLKNLAERFIIPTGGRSLNAFACWAPLNHDMGMFLGVLSPIYQAANNVIAPPSYYMRNPVRWFQLIAEHKVESVAFTNSALASSLAFIERNKIDIPNLPFFQFYLGAEKLNTNVLQRAIKALNKYGITEKYFFNAYGMAENGLAAACSDMGGIKTLCVTISGSKVEVVNENTDKMIDLASIGTVFNDHIITIRDEADNILPELTLGEINIESHCVTPGYYNAPKKTAQAITKDGRLKTKDLGFFYQSQFYYYGRKDDLIIIGGRNIVPDDIELAVEQLTNIRAGATALITVEHQTTGITLLVLLVEYAESAVEHELDVLRKNIQNIIYNKYELMLGKVEFIKKGGVEKTSSGKKRRKIIKQRYQENILTLIKNEICV